MKTAKLTIIVPVFNEIDTLPVVYKKLKNLNFGFPVQIIYVDDKSTDGSREYLRQKEKANGRSYEFMYKRRNEGKGSAVRLGIKQAKGDYFIVQDADLEYDPIQIGRLLNYATKNNKKIVFGSRNGDIKNTYQYPLFYHGMKLITWLINRLYSQRITDPETCYKLIHRDIYQKLDVKENGFGIEIELTSKILKMREDINEVSISYKPRSFREGKKIGFLDGVEALFLVFKYYVQN